MLSLAVYWAYSTRAQKSPRFSSPKPSQTFPDHSSSVCRGRVVAWCGVEHPVKERVRSHVVLLKMLMMTVAHGANLALALRCLCYGFVVDCTSRLCGPLDGRHGDKSLQILGNRSVVCMSLLRPAAVPGSCTRYMSGEPFHPRTHASIEHCSEAGSPHQHTCATSNPHVRAAVIAVSRAALYSCISARSVCARHDALFLFSPPCPSPILSSSLVSDAVRRPSSYDGKVGAAPA